MSNNQKPIEAYLRKYTNHQKLISIDVDKTLDGWIKCNVLCYDFKTVSEVYFRLTKARVKHRHIETDKTKVEYGIMREERVLNVDFKFI
jgi:mRNA-degrading endonuclease HigB of HigAB toxin-antitoxin module